MTAVQEPRTATRTVTVQIDGRSVTVTEGTTIYDAARQAGIDIPVLCHDERYDPVGVCRMCVVDTGGRVFAAACVRPCDDGMQVTTSSPGAFGSPTSVGISSQASPSCSSALMTRMLGSNDKLTPRVDGRT